MGHPRCQMNVAPRHVASQVAAASAGVFGEQNQGAAGLGAPCGVWGRRLPLPPSPARSPALAEPRLLDLSPSQAPRRLGHAELSPPRPGAAAVGAASGRDAMPRGPGVGRCRGPRLFLSPLSLLSFHSAQPQPSECWFHVLAAPFQCQPEQGRIHHCCYCASTHPPVPAQGCPQPPLPSCPFLQPPPHSAGGSRGWAETSRPCTPSPSLLPGAAHPISWAHVPRCAFSALA